MMAVINQAAFDCGKLAERLALGYYVHDAVLKIGADPRALSLAPPIEKGQNVPIGRILKKGRTTHTYHFEHFLSQAQDSADSLFADLQKSWFIGAFIQVADALSRNSYFDRAPELEMVRHIRNGIAHGNLFEIRQTASLARFPAHNRLAWVKQLGQDFEITAALHGTPVLFDYLGPGDCLDLLQSVGLYLIRMGNGDPLRR